jgi:hypothetical protein
MANQQIARDASLPVPQGLDEDEQQAAMLKAAKQHGGVHRGEQLTVVPLGSPPLPGPWRAAGKVNAPGSGKPYTVYMITPPKRGPGIIGTHTNAPVSDAGTMPVIENKPNTQTGITPAESPQAPKNQLAENWLGAGDSDALVEYTEDLQKVLDNPNATEDQISEKVKAGLAEARRVSLLGSGDRDNSMVSALMQQVGRAVNQVAKMKSDALEDVIQQEEKSPNSVPDAKFQDRIKAALAAERQRQLMGAGNDGPSEALVLTGQAITIVADRKADAVQDLLSKDKQSPGSVTDSQFSGAIKDLLGMVREVQLLGASSTKTNSALANVGEVMKVVIQRKAESLRKLIQQKAIPGSGVTDDQIQQATDDLNQLKEQGRRMGVSAP